MTAAVGRHKAALALALVGLAVAAALPDVSHGASFAAGASVDPAAQYLGDTTGPVLTFTVHNTGTSASIGAVEIAEPSTSFTIGPIELAVPSPSFSVLACPQAPAGWSTQASSSRCRYRSAPGTADDIAPGASSSQFRVRAATAGGRADFSGTWRVGVSRSNNLDWPSDRSAAAGEPPGLDVRVHAFEVLDAVVAGAAATPGSACPPANRQAASGSTRVVVICGRNRSTVSLTPTAAQAALGGTFIADDGVFSSGAIAARSASSRVLGNWSGARVAGAGGTGRTVVAKIGASTKETSPLTTLGGYEVINVAPTAHAKTAAVDEDGSTTITLSAADPQGDALTFAIVSGPVDGSFVASGAVSCAGIPSLCTRDYLYTPAANHNGADSIQYTASDGSSTSANALVSITVNPENDTPLAGNASRTVAEDANTSIDLAALVSDVETSDANLTYTIVDNPAHGGLSGSGSSRTYTPVANFNGADSFTFKVTDRGDPDNCSGAPCDAALTSAVRTVSITVDPVNDAPPASGTSTTVAEDGSVGVDLAALVSDVETTDANLTYAIVDAPVHGALTGGGSSPTYMPAANYRGADSFTFEVTDRGDPDNCSSVPCDAAKTSSVATVSITVTPVNDAPLASDTSTTVAEDANTSIDLAALASDVETSDANLTYTIVTAPAHGGLTGSGAARTYTPDPNYNGADSFTYEVTDRGDPDNCSSPPCDAALTSSVATVSITVDPDNDAPLASATSTTVVEDGSVDVDLATLVSDVETTDANLTYTIVDSTAHGALTGSGTLRTYTPAASYTGADSFTFTVTDRGDPDNCSGPPCAAAKTSSPQTVSITVTSANTAPSITTTATTLAYGESDPATAIDPGLTLTDDSPTITSATAKLATGYVSTEDVLALAPGFLPIGVTATVFGDTVTLSGPASPGQYEALLRAVTYANTSENPATAARTVTFTATDDEALSGSNTRAIAVTRRNAPPVAVDDAYTTSEDGTLSVPPPTGVLANDTDIDVPDTKQVVAVDGGSLTQSFSGGRTLFMQSGGGFTFNLGSHYQGLTAGETATFTFTYTMRDSGGAEDTATVTITITGATEAPVAVADTFNAVGNTGLFVGTSRPAGQAGKVVTGSLLDNDTDGDTPHADLVARVRTDATTSRNGRISVNADGSFAYRPPAGVTGGPPDTFTYTVCDGTPCPGGTGVSQRTGTLNLPLAGQVWYVDNTEPIQQNGTSATPFNDLNVAQNVMDAGDTVFVFAGDGTTKNHNQGFRMTGSGRANTRLIGEVSGLTLDPDGAGALPAAELYPPTPGKAPRLTSAFDVVTLGVNSTVDGFTIDPGGAGGGSGGAISGSNVDSAANATIANVSIIDTGAPGLEPGLELHVMAGTQNVSNLVVDNTGATGVPATATGVKLTQTNANFADAGTISIRTAGTKALDVVRGDMGGSTFDEITVTGSTVGSVELQLTTGTTNLGDGVGTDLSLSTTSAAGPALGLFSAGDVRIGSAGSDDITASSGQAVWIEDTPATVELDTLTSTGANGAVILRRLGSGTFAAGPASAITNPSGGGFLLEGASTGDVSYAGSMTDPDGGAIVTINGATGGTKRFTGPISGGSAITLVNNTGATIRFDGGVTLATGLGLAFNASGGGTVVVTDPAGAAANTLATTSGRPLNVSGTNIGSDGLTFESISAGTATTGPPNGIVLSNTGASGRLIVTGKGGTCTNADTSGCTGGEIARTTGADSASVTPAGAGVVLDRTLNPSLTRMWIHDHPNYAIRANAVAGMTLSNSVINGANGDSAALSPFEDASVYIDGLTGSATVSDTHISGGFHDNVRVRHGSPDRMTFTNTTFGSDGPRPGRHALAFENADGGGAMKVTITDSTFQSAGWNLLDYRHSGAGAGDLVLTDNTFSNNHPAITTGRGGVELSQFGGAGTTMSISANSFRDARGAAVRVLNQSSGTQAGTFTNNTIGAASAVNSGSADGSGLEIAAQSGSSNWTATDNTIRGYNGAGIEALAPVVSSSPAASGTLNTTITGNTIVAPGSAANAKHGIRYLVGRGTNPADSFTVCANITSNTIDASGAAGAGGTGDDVRLDLGSASTIRLPGYLGAGNDTTAVQNFVNANNSAGTTTLATLTPAPGGGGFTGAGSACP